MVDTAGHMDNAELIRRARHVGGPALLIALADALENALTHVRNFDEILRDRDAKSNRVAELQGEQIGLKKRIEVLEKAAQKLCNTQPEVGDVEDVDISGVAFRELEALVTK